MLILTVVIFILIAVVLLVIELLVVPGISIAGIGSFVCFVIGMLIAYIKLGSQAGTITLLASLFAAVVTIYFSLRPGTWKKMTLDAQIEGKSGNIFSEEIIKPGCTGITTTRLAPIGHVKINGHSAEAQSTGEYIDVNIPIEVVHVEHSKIIVKPIKT